MAAKKNTELKEIVENLVNKIRHLEEKVQKVTKLEEKIKHLEDVISGKESDSFKRKVYRKILSAAKVAYGLKPKGS